MATVECSFKSDRYYKHFGPTKSKEKNQIIERIKQLEKVVQTVTNQDGEIKKLMEKVEILEKTVVELNNKVEIKKLYETEKVVHSLT